MIETFYKNLSFIYSTVDSAKSANLLMIIKHLENQGKHIITLKPGNDDRDGEYIKSRVGIKTKADNIVYLDTNLYNLLSSKLLDNPEKYIMIFIDEVQFLTEKQILDVSEIVDRYNIGVACYGLLTDFYGKMFPTSKLLMELADNRIDFGNTVCKCGRKATMNMKIDKNGKPTRDGSSISPGFNFIPICRKCYMEVFNEKDR